MCMVWFGMPHLYLVNQMTRLVQTICHVILALFEQRVGKLSERLVSIRLQQDWIAFYYYSTKLIERIRCQQCLDNRYQVMGRELVVIGLAGIGFSLFFLLTPGSSFILNIRPCPVPTSYFAQAMRNAHDVLGNLHIAQVGATLFGRDVLNKQGVQFTRLLLPDMLLHAGWGSKHDTVRCCIVKQKRCPGTMNLTTVGT